MTLLFTTPTCPNCKHATKILDSKKIKYEKINVDENPDVIKEYGLKQVPTLIIEDNDGTTRVSGASEIIKFLS